MIKVVLSLLLLTSAIAQGRSDFTISQKIDGIIQKNRLLKDIKQKASFSYGITYLGPSLSDKYRFEDGVTYNRFNSGQDWKNTDNDATSSHQIYHAFSFGYQVHKNVKLSYSSTYQDDLYKGVDYNSYWSDGSLSGTYERRQGISHNNQRINAFVTNIYSNNYLFVMSNFYYELPTTELSQDFEMTYGLGVQPVIGIFSNVTGMSHGFKLSIERDYYKNQEFYNHPGDIYPTRRQTLRASITTYLGYMLSDKLHLKTELTFDWDKKGDQIENLHEFNKNMDDILEVGLNYYLSRNISFGGKIQKAISDPSPEKSAILGSLNLSI